MFCSVFGVSVFHFRWKYNKREDNFISRGWVSQHCRELIWWYDKCNCRVKRNMPFVLCSDLKDSRTWRNLISSVLFCFKIPVLCKSHIYWNKQTALQPPLFSSPPTHTIIIKHMGRRKTQHKQLSSPLQKQNLTKHQILRCSEWTYPAKTNKKVGCDKQKRTSARKRVNCMHTWILCWKW